MEKRASTSLSSYWIAVTAVAAATLLRLLLDPVLGPNVPYITYFPAVMLAAWYGRLGAAVLTTFLAVPAAAYFFIPPKDSLLITETEHLLGLGLFIMVGLSIAFMGEAMHKSRRRAEQNAAALDEQREYLRVTLASIGDAVIVTDLQGRVTFMNQVAQSLTGWAEPAASGQPLKAVFKIVNERTRQEVESPVAAVLKEGKSVGLADRTVLIKKDGGELPIDDSGSPILNKRGEVAGVVLVFRDVTERRRAQEASSLLALIVESSDDAIIGKTLDGQIVSWNSGAERLYGYSAEETIGRPISILVPHDHADDVPHILDRLKAGEHISHYETVRVKKDGTHINVALTISPIKDAEGNIKGASTIARNITELKQAERSQRFLAETGAVLAASLDYSTTVESIVRLAVPEFADWCIVDIVEENGKIDRVAVAGARPAHTGLLEQLRDQYPPTWQSPTPAARALRSGEPVLINDLSAERLGTLTRDEGQLKIMLDLEVRSAIAAPMLARGHVLGAITFGLSAGRQFGQRLSGGLYGAGDLALAQDLARRAALALDNARLYRASQEATAAREEALALRNQLLAREQAARADAEAANRAKDEFLATVSHELRTPLNAILGWAHMLRASSLDQPTSARALETIERNAKSQAQLIEDILDVSRIVTGKLRLDVRPVGLGGVIESALDSIRPAAEAKEIRLQVVLDPKAGPIAGDPSRLQQVVWNLVSNAVKFTPKGGIVQVRLERINSHVEVVVTDTGQGVPPEFLPHVFDRFRQADSTTTRAHGGLGLGLAIVRHIVEMHGGTAHAESQGKGLGSTFTVKLPLMAVRKEADETDRLHPTSSGGLSFEPNPVFDGLRVMVVDDEPDTCEMVMLVLSQCGCQVMTCISASEALEALRGFQPDVLVSDIEMPGGDGYEFIKKVRGLRPEEGGQVPALALTAYARVEDRMRALSAGFQMHVPKPVEPAELTVVIASLARRGRVVTSDE